MNHVTAILVTYNPDYELLPHVVEQITQQVDSVILIDNASTCSEKIFSIIQEYSNIHFYSLSENIGLAAAQNLAISKVQEKCNYVIFFDQDSVIQKDLIKQLLIADFRLRQAGENVAAVGPSFIDPTNNMIYPATVYKGPFIKKVDVTSQPIEATFIIASGCLIKTSAINEIGLMYDGFFIDYIDVEWCLRAKSKGYSVYVIPNAKMYHTIGDSRISILGRTISIHNPMRRYYLIRNSILICKLKYIPIGYKIRECMFNIIRAILSLLLNNNKKLTLKMIFRGIIDGVKGITGRAEIK